VIAAGSTITVGGGNLFAMAAQAYGDATLWTRIAAANGLTDPWVSGIVTLSIPRAGGRESNGGILGGV
jgi:nucleoid-associated protein YgaU